MEITHDEDGVSVDMSNQEAIDFAAFLFRRSNRSGVEELQRRLHEIFIGVREYERQIAGFAALLKGNKPKPMYAQDASPAACADYPWPNSMNVCNTRTCARKCNEHQSNS